MAVALDPKEVLRSTDGKENFQRLTRLLIGGGASLFREIFDAFCPPSQLPRKLSMPTTKSYLKAAKLTKPQWDCLYPSPGVYGKSTDFDVTLLFRLLPVNMRPDPSCHGMGCFASQYTSQSNGRFSQNKILPKLDLRS